ncbi:MAG: carbonic anhydrase [Corallococcus sp.]|nr:carbonic anhydrase [Corallococcus sp.]MCM1359746.1 carbonic anhydrase [Corallococcus sp.]MCM1395455.1 carbonic anhydrase [Corallococcus sp.]
MQNNIITADEALAKLRNGNAVYLGSKTGAGDVSLERRVQTCADGQRPYAVVVACSDSRVPVEHIFSAGIGELFVVRVAGNVIDNNQLGSIQYAVDHLGCKLVVVLGHTHCGAVSAAMGDNCGYVKFITDEIKGAIGGETDVCKASVRNVQHGVEKIKSLLFPPSDVKIVGALYRTESGTVDFFIKE